ncbi:MAG TPA: hypothetical protein VEY91_10185 [Candidatus Limnocylindria bacterium]|nr:hypothetical protein [Candidatus Limnocylindria bacterium]
MLFIYSPMFFMATLPAAHWALSILRRRFRTIPAEVAMAIFVGLAVTICFCIARAVFEPWEMSRDWFATTYVLAVCVVYFGVGFRVYGWLGGFYDRVSTPGPGDHDEVLPRAAFDTIWGILAIGWSGMCAAFVQLALMANSSD